MKPRKSGDDGETRASEVAMDMSAGLRAALLGAIDQPVSVEIARRELFRGLLYAVAAPDNWLASRPRRATVIVYGTVRMRDGCTLFIEIECSPWLPWAP